MTDTNEKVPGHSPAAKVGGMRVTANAHTSSDEPKPTSGPLNAMATTGGDAALALASSPKSSNQQAIARELHEESVRNKHAKLQPAVEKHHHNAPKPHIQQPSKQ
ncbi:uncharacterized protein LOC134842493 [Symsagittifera roscoffensis]|uniref:uncharacterized protein LOC134842493 n=1 Tax=Symsagittifera roscoffensis TaxID=84072 RepID=UPI00307C24BF